MITNKSNFLNMMLKDIINNIEGIYSVTKEKSK